MNIAIIGYGKMGRIIEEKALEKNHKITIVIDPFVNEEKTIRGSVVNKSIEAISAMREKPDIAVDFTRPDQAVGNILFLAREKIPVVVGTTGWYDRMPEVAAAVGKAGSSLFWAPNYSLGMNIFYRIAEYSAGIFDPFAEYDAGGMEIHHNKKADSPSGTAKLIAEKVLKGMKRKKKTVYEKLDHPPAADEFHFASLRVGSVQGVHSVIFDSQSDTVEITHTIRNRDGMAAGALQAAEWLFSKKKSGIFTMDDMLTDILERKVY